MADLSRRTFFGAVPLFGAAALAPTAAFSASQTAGDKFAYHQAGLMQVIAETAGPCDGYRFIGGFDAYQGKPWRKVERGWILQEEVRQGGRKIPVERWCYFDPTTGEHINWTDMPDLSGWTPWVPRHG
jgi:hypothetical protein